MDNIMKITSDARFRLARSLMTSGGDSTTNSFEGAIEIFASLLEETRNTCGETSLTAALCYYEYGNALFRAVVRRKPLDSDNENHDEDKKPAAKPSSAAARKRSLDDDKTKEPGLSVSSKRAKIENNVEEGDNDDDDIALALEMLSTSFSIFDWHSSTDEDKKTKPDEEGKRYSLTQIPRVLSTIGDIHSHCGKFGDAVDAYCRALPYRENAWEERQKPGKGESLSVDDLKCQRLLVETYALVAEALLACKEGEDVVCANDEDKDDTNGATGKVLVAAKDRVDFAESHYATAREKLQDIGTCLCAAMLSTCSIVAGNKLFLTFRLLSTQSNKCTKWASWQLKTSISVTRRKILATW